jgi:K+-sensing histidine kinase KdpD
VPSKAERNRSEGTPVRGDTPLAYAAATAEHSAAGMPERPVQPAGFTNRLATLHEIILQIDAAHTQDAILSLLRSQIRWLMPHECSVLCLHDRFKTRYQVVDLMLPARTPSLDGMSFASDEGTPGVVIQMRSPIIMDLAADAGAQGSVDRMMRAHGMHSVLAIPLQGGDETSGVLIFATSNRSAYGPQDLVIGRLLAAQIAIALQHASMFSDAQKRIIQIELVNELAEKLTSTLDLESLLHSATSTIQKTFNYTDVTIFLVDRRERVARLVAHTGASADLEPFSYVQPLSEGIIGWVATYGERILANDVLEDKRYINPSGLKTRAELAIPIRVEREVAGILNVEDERPHCFDETDAVVLETLCDQLGGALHNAQLYEEIRRTNEKLTELDRMKSDFLSIVSHDFRSPLSSIMLAARSIMKKEQGDSLERRNQYLNVIVDQASKLIALAEDTLSITRLESGKLNYTFSPVNVERLVMDAAAQVSFTGKHRVRFDFSKGLSYVRGDQAKLRQVLQNLLSNAVKYSPQGGLIEVSAADYGPDQLLVKVQDEGIGIPHEQMDRLFQRFSRVDTDEARKIRGTGLGLWICKEVVRAHGGEIWVDSSPGRGSAFSFTLRKVGAEATSTGLSR